MTRIQITGMTIVSAVILSVFFFASTAMAESPVPISAVMDSVRQGDVARIVVSSETSLQVYYKDGSKQTSKKESGISIYTYLDKTGVAEENMPIIEVDQMGDAGWGMLFGWLPLILIGGSIFLIMMLMRPSQSSNQDKTFQFGKSRARVIRGDRPNTTFADVAGADEAKEELKEVVEFLKFPARFASVGARIPKGLLLVGPPGTGKTLLARAVAGEAGVPFFSISGSEFVEMFVGVGASRVRDLFEQAKGNVPCIIFIDEIDAVGRQRGIGLGGGNDEREQTLNQILVEMDGFDKNINIIIIAATNRPDVLDPALLRPGRFDRQVMLDRPDAAGRKAILEIHCRGKPIADEVELESLAKQTAGFAGADLENLVNEAAILAARRGKTLVGMEELTEAIDRVIAGPARKSRIISQQEKITTAYHEAGHALVAHILSRQDVVRKISIIPRGMMGGFTRVEPDEDRYLSTKSQFKDTLAWALGGRASEEIVFGDITTGASNDIQKATEIARKMVIEYGMSDRMGPIAYGRVGDPNLGYGDSSGYGNEVAQAIDEEVKSIVDESYRKSLAILTEHRKRLDHLADLLVHKETLEGKELADALDLIPEQPANGSSFDFPGIDKTAASSVLEAPQDTSRLPAP